MFNFRELIELWRTNNLMQQALDDSYSMLESTQEMFAESMRSLRQSDSGEMELNVYEKDAQVNKYEREVRHKVMKHLALTSGANLIPGLILTSIVIDVERIGDYTKNIMDLAREHPRRMGCGRSEETIQKLENAVGALFDASIPALRSSDSKRAHRLINDNWWILKECDAVIVDLIRNGDNNLTVSDAVSVGLYTRYIKRITAHLINILSSVVNPFEAVGFHPDTAADDN